MSLPTPPGPFRPGFWRSPLRGRWLTSVLGSVLLVLVVLVALTGFLSHAAYEPDLGRNALVSPDLPFTTFFAWPTGPSWLYALTQGVHVNGGLVAIPVLLAKLWSVIPRLFAWPPLRTPAEAIERLSIALLVASTGFLFATGVANIQYWYVFGFDFVKAHYYAAVVFVAALAVHLVVKLPIAWRTLRGAERRARRPRRRDARRAHGQPARAAARRRRRVARAARGQRRRVDRRPAARHRVPRPAARRRLPGQQDRGRRRRDARR